MRAADQENFIAISHNLLNVGLHSFDNLVYAGISLKNEIAEVKARRVGSSRQVRYDDNGRAGLSRRFEMIKETDAVRLGHQKVKENEVNVVFLQNFKAAASVYGREHFKSGQLELLFERLAVTSFVFNY